ncbi:MAG: DUF4124 domain-containing protein [Casimicrobiaceae bacterium]
MRPHLLATALAIALFCIFAPRPAEAEIYTWVDAMGRLNVGNLPPPNDARVTKVVRETPQNPYNDAARAAAQAAEVEALAQRVNQLQAELQTAARAAPPQPQVIVVQAPAPAPYIVEAPAPPAYAQDCGNGWGGCNGWWGSAFAPFATFVYLPSARNAKPEWNRGRHGQRGPRDGDPRDGGPARRPPMKMAAFARH